MFGYSHDPETGGLLLNGLPTFVSNEPRPVYASELNILGLDSYWKYENQDDVPYMWAEMGRYFYRGELVFSTVGGSLREKPGVVLTPLKDKDGKQTDSFALPVGSVLQSVDLDKMIEKNKEWLLVAEQTSIKKIYDVYRRRHKKLDCFHVAFSGGKDSIVLLELVKRALPASSFMVVFGDTKMEFPDTYKVVDQIEEECRKEGISFYRAASRFEPEESWRLFGPPSRVIRWCCTVHKSTPQTLKIREILKKNDYVGLDYVGVRMFESVKRAGYEEECYSEKQKGQFSFNGILNWSSAEVWLYTYFRKLVINETYKKGNSRAGCLFCPMGGGKGDFFQYASYPDEMDKYVNIVKEMNAPDANSPERLETYVTKGGWNARKNGRDLTIKDDRLSEKIDDGNLVITLKSPRTDWKEWIKTLGSLPFSYDVEEKQDSTVIKAPVESLNRDLKLQRKFKQVFVKAAFCVGCRACEVNCRNGCISFRHGLRIDNCLHCGACHDLKYGCWEYHSIIKPSEGDGMKKGSINSFANHAPKREWLEEYVEKTKEGQPFWHVWKGKSVVTFNSRLGSQEDALFKKFMKDAGFISASGQENKLHEMLLRKDGLNNPCVWGIACVNFTSNPEFAWFVRNLEIGRTISRQNLDEMILEAGITAKNVVSVVNAYKRFCLFPLGSVMKFGEFELENQTRLRSVTRTKMVKVDSRVLLYSLYRYAEEYTMDSEAIAKEIKEGTRTLKVNQFTLSSLFDQEYQTVGISPALLFGYSREEMATMLRGLSVAHSQYINVTFTHDLEAISLNEETSSKDILNLF